MFICDWTSKWFVDWLQRLDVGSQHAMQQCSRSNDNITVAAALASTMTSGLNRREAEVFPKYAVQM